MVNPIVLLEERLDKLQSEFNNFKQNVEDNYVKKNEVQRVIINKVGDE